MIRPFQKAITLPIALGLGLFSLQAQAQFAAVVPEGVLAVVGTQRFYKNQTSTWDAHGLRKPLNQKSQLKFDGEHLLRGEGGADLQSLARELNEYDPNANNPTSILRRLNLGTLNVGGSARVNVHYLALALGLPGKSTFFMAAPLVDMSVKTSFALEGINNAKAIQDELGELPFTQVRNGLSQAAQLTEKDIKASIEAAEYTGVDSWRYRNLTDSIAGFAFDIIAPEPPGEDPQWALQAEAFLSIPTGHVDHPDIISDVGLGTGAWGLGCALTPTLSLGRYSLGLETNALAFLPTRQVMRIPEVDETIIPASRRATVDVQTGLDWGTTAVVSRKFDWFEPQYRLSWKRHERDTIKGKLAGNYNALMAPTEKQQLEHALWLYFSTIDLYKEKKFPIPLRVKLAAQQLFKGWNSFENTYFEIQLTSFLPTPWMPE